MYDVISKNLKTKRTFDEQKILKWKKERRTKETVLVVVLATLSIIISLMALV